LVLKKSFGIFPPVEEHVEKARPESAKRLISIDLEKLFYLLFIIADHFNDLYTLVETIRPVFHKAGWVLKKRIGSIVV